MLFRKKLLPHLVAAACECLSGGAHSADGAADQKLDGVVVTATRSEMAVSDAPAAVTVVTEKQIAGKNASRLGDALSQVPSLYLDTPTLGQTHTGTGAGGFSLRGLDSTRTLVLIDGLPIQDSYNSRANFRSVLVDDIARIEVVPGAFSSLYGSNAIGGVINVITKQPEKHELTVKLKKGFADAAGEDVNVYFRDKLSSGLGITAGFGLQDRNGYVSEYVVRTPSTGAAGAQVTGATPTTTTDGKPAYIVGDKGSSPWRQVNGNVKLSYELSAQDRIYGGVSYSEFEAAYKPFNTYLRDADGKPVSGGTVGIDGQKVTLSESYFVTAAPLNQGDTRYFAGFEGTLAQKYKLKAELAKTDRENWYSYYVGTSTWGGGTGTLNEMPNSSVDGIVQLSFPVGERHFLVTGLSIRRDTVDRKIYALSSWREPESKTGLNEGTEGESTTTSLFAQDEISVSDALTVYVGGRFDQWETEGKAFKNTAPTYDTTYSSRQDSAFSPKLSTVYKPWSRVTLRASVGKSFRAPTNSELYATAFCCSTYYYSNPDLEPETATTWELGGDWLPTDKLKATVSFYETRLEDMIYTKTLTTTTTPATYPDKQKINAGEARIRGVELSAGAKLARWLDLNASWAYIDSEVLSNEADPATVGKRLTNAPKNLATVGLSAQQGPWTGSLEAKWTGKSFVTERNTDVVEGVPGARDAYTMVNAKVGYQLTKTVKGSIAINNLLDEQAYSFYLLPGRNVTAEVIMSF